MQIMDQFGAAPGAESVRMPDGTERTLAAEHAAAILVNEQPAFRVVCTPELLPQLALGRLLTEGWITSADEVERVAVCAQGLKISVQLRHPLAAAEQAGQEVPSCCTDNLTLASPVQLPPLAPVPQREIPAAWVDALADAMGQGLPLYRATHAVHSCLLLRAGKILYRCEDLGRHNALDKLLGHLALAGRLAEPGFVAMTSRASYELVRKCARLGIPVLATVSAPTALAVQVAQQAQLQLWGLCRPPSALRYV